MQKTLRGTGIVFNGPNPWDPQILDDRFYKAAVLHGTLGIGESYMKEWWKCEDLVALYFKALMAGSKDKLPAPARFLEAIRGFITKHVNFQTKKGALDVGRAHYDVGNDLYRRMLDKYMTYTCGYWGAGAETLDEAQEDKLRLVCEKLKLPPLGSEGPKMRILDIGCGWGSLGRYAATHYHASVVGVTISKEQIALGTELCEGLDVDLRFCDYRDVTDGPYDAIVSIGMFEHVGPLNYETFFQTANRLLKEGGLFLLHTIAGLHSVTDTDAWIERYIFPNSVIPSMAQISDASEGYFFIQDQHNFGRDYARTLRCWYDNIHAKWDELPSYSPEWIRMWEYYLNTCEASFLAEYNHLVQLVMSKGYRGEQYRGVRYDAIPMAA